MACLRVGMGAECHGHVMRSTRCWYSWGPPELWSGRRVRRDTGMYADMSIHNGFLRQGNGLWGPAGPRGQSPKKMGTHALAEGPQWSGCNVRTFSVFFFSQALADWQSPLAKRYLRELSKSGIRAVQCYDCPTAQRGGGHDPEVGEAKSETRRCSGNCHARRHPKALLEHVEDCSPR